MKKTKIEIEKRGSLSQKGKEHFLSFLKEKAKLLCEYNQLSVYCESDSPYLGEIENTKISISITLLKNILTKKTKYLLKAKTGKMESGLRKEIIIPFYAESLDDILHFLELFDIKTGCPRFFHRYNFKYGKYEISIKEKGYTVDHFEIETIIESEDEIEKENRKIDEFVKSLGLNIYSEEEYKEKMLETFRKYPPIPFSEIDFSIIDS